MATSLFACAYGIADALPEPADREPAAPDVSSSADAESSSGAVSREPCDQPRHLVHVSIDGSDFVFEVPAMCDPRPYRELGDPPP